MTIYNLGSINIDHVYSLETLPKPGETIAATSLTTGLGGKGANQSIAIARAGGDVVHIGAVGPEGRWTVDRLKAAGVDVSGVETSDVPTGHAMITVDAMAENVIVLFPGANQELRLDKITAVLANASPGDWLLMQNETNGGVEAALIAREMGLKIAYCAAPFDPRAVERLLPYIDLLSVNEVEEAQLRADLPDAALSDIAMLVTYGAKGAAYIAPEFSERVAAFKVDPVDTTGAGDTFLGYALAGISSGLPLRMAMRRASAASAVQVTRIGAAEAIPNAAEVDAFLACQSV